MSLISLLLLLFLARGPVWAQADDNHAAVVVVHGDGSVVTACVAFDEPEITGLTALQRSGLVFSTVAGPLGVTVCSLDDEGCPPSDCFCECTGTPCAYWNYYHLAPDGAWVYANEGAAMSKLQDGDVDGWVWGDGSTTPPPVSFESICETGAAEASPAPTATLPSTPTPEGTVSATATPPSTSVPTPAPTATPVAGHAGGGTPLSYVGFVAILILIGVGYLLLRKGKGS